MPRISILLAVVFVLVSSAGVYLYKDAVVDTTLQICDGLQFDDCGVQGLPGLTLIDSQWSIESKNKITVNITMGNVGTLPATATIAISSLDFNGDVIITLYHLITSLPRESVTSFEVVLHGINLVEEHYTVQISTHVLISQNPGLLLNLWILMVLLPSGLIIFLARKEKS
jgi:hypothetical protein